MEKSSNLFFIEIHKWINGDAKNVLREQFATEAAARAQLVAYASVDSFGATSDFAGYLYHGSERIAIMNLYGAGAYEFVEVS